SILGIGPLGRVVLGIPAGPGPVFTATLDAREEIRLAGAHGLRTTECQGKTPFKLPETQIDLDPKIDGVHGNPSIVVDHVGATPFTDLDEGEAHAVGPVSGEMVARGHHHVAKAVHPVVAGISRVTIE